MKKTLIATILGIAASLASSYGQGSFFFSTYFVGATSTSAPVKWGAQVPAGETAGGLVSSPSSILFDLTYSFIGTAGLATVDTHAAQSLVAETGFSGLYIDDGTQINLPIGTYPNGAGAGPAITMTITASGTFNGTPVQGSLTWVEPGFTQAPAQLFAAYPGTLAITAVPEPTTLALAGLGAAGMLLFRKRA